MSYLLAEFMVLNCQINMFVRRVSAVEFISAANHIFRKLWSLMVKKNDGADDDNYGTNDNDS